MTQSLSIPDAPGILSIHGVDATDTFLNLPPNLTEQQEREMISGLRTVIRGMPWWTGDFALHYKAKLEAAKKREEEQAKAEARKPREHADYADTLAEAWGLSAGHIRNAVTVAEFYPISCRHENLSFRHHHDAMLAAGGPNRATKDSANGWLKKAKVEGWSCADLRQQALPTTTDSRPPSTPEANPYDLLDSADKWATQHQAEIRSISRERAENLLVRLQSIAALIDHLRALTGMKGHDVLSINERFTGANR